MADELRALVREGFRARCAYCGVHEDAVGATLTVNHHRPRAHGGTDDVANVVYCLRLNRPQLVAYRLARQAEATLTAELAVSRRRVEELERAVLDLRAALESTADEIERRSKGRPGEP
ncbi:HNH endonuclease signature motif containing protein [Sorangium sp. So ce1504]|uniref:HNH endonuclease n=1 Tax=Sorangium sp. So ce1504 TaxID=3133337 RepID=UPI003F5F9E93